MVAGVPGHFLPDNIPIPEENCRYVYFETSDLPFPVVGMSDCMPYESSLFSGLSGSERNAYKAAFENVLIEAVQTFQPDLIHSHHLWVVSGMARRLFPDIPIVTSCHGSDLRQKKKCGGMFQHDVRFCRHLDHIFALTHVQKKEILEEFSISEKKISILGSGYEHTRFRNAGKKSDGRCQILFAGKLSRSKGVLWLLKALAKIEDEDFQLHLAGGGSGTAYEMSRQLARKLRGKVCFHGPLAQKDLAALMREAHLFVLPSFYEGLPLVLLEALSSGCRIITTGLPGIEEIFGRYHGKDIHLIDLPDLESIDAPYKKDESVLEEKLTEAIKTQITRIKHDPNIDLTNVQPILERFTWENIFKKAEAVYRNVLKENTRY